MTTICPKILLKPQFSNPERIQGVLEELMQTTNMMKWWQTLTEARGKDIYEIARKIQGKL
jgi:hypothetical protein